MSFKPNGKDKFHVIRRSREDTSSFCTSGKINIVGTIWHKFLWKKNNLESIQRRIYNHFDDTRIVPHYRLMQFAFVFVMKYCVCVD